MTIQLKSLEWDNYFSFGPSNRIDFTAGRVTQILGVNGNGKSSIPLILEEVCYNKNSKGISKANIPNRYLDNPATRAKLEFSVNGLGYSLEVTRKSSIKVTLKQGSTDISGHTSTNTFAQFESLVGMDFKTFSQLIYQSTTSSLQFLTATDTNRKKFLIDLLQLTEYLEYQELFKEAAKDVQNALNVAQGKKETLLKWLRDNEVEDLNYRAEISFSENSFELQNELGNIKSKISNIAAENRKIDQNNKYKLMREKTPPLSTDPGKSIPFEEQQKALGSEEAVKRAAEAHLLKLHKLGDSCPTCDQDIAVEFKQRLIDEQETALGEAESAITKLKAEITDIKAHNEAVSQYRKAQKEFEDLCNLIDPQIPEDILDLSDLQAEERRLVADIADIEARIAEVTRMNTEVIKHNSRIEIYLEQAEKTKAEVEALSAEVEAISQDLADLTILKKAYSTTGLIAYKIENLVKDLEEKANEYLADFSSGRFTIEFSVEADKLNVVLTDNGIKIDISALSSGELARVNTSTLLAIRSLMNSISKNSINVLFLDEVISVLDDEGREKLVEILLKENELNTYLVSHSWSHPLLTKLEVLKEDNISRIEYG